MNLNSSEIGLVGLDDVNSELAKRDFKEFVLATMPHYKVNWHHELLMEKLQLFAEGKIKRLMVFMPPQHGKSELTSRRLPAYILGLNPNAKIIGCSYSGDLSKSFNRDVQRIIDDPVYYNIFPNTTLNSSNVRTSARGSYLRNSDLFEVVNHIGFYKSVGVGGSLTGTPGDIGIIDDPVKDAVEAESATYRARVWDWFTQVFLTRLHNDSQIIVTQTRWNLDDLSGRILSRMNKNNEWTVLSLPAIKEGYTHPMDSREEGAALWPEKHSLKRLLGIKDANPRAFHALYQQNPKPFEGGLIYPKYHIIEQETFENAEGMFLFGLDFGYSNASALVGLVVDIKNKKLYIDEWLYKSGLTPEMHAKEFDKLGVTGGIEIIADSARGDIIEDLSRRFNVKPASKGPGSVFFGIGKVNEYTLYITRESKNIINEIEMYRFKEDKDGNPTNEPIKEHDHAMDAIRYGLVYAVTNYGGGVKAYTY